MYWLPIDRGRDVERVDQRQAAAEQRRQRPRHLRRGELARDRPEHRQPQQQPVEARLLPRLPQPQRRRRDDRRRSADHDQQQNCAAHERPNATMIRVTSGSCAPKLA